MLTGYPQASFLGLRVSGQNGGQIRMHAAVALIILAPNELTTLPHNAMGYCPGETIGSQALSHYLGSQLILERQDMMPYACSRSPYYP
jgi:hypothetical protein